MSGEVQPSKVQVIQLPRWIVWCPPCANELGTWQLHRDALAQAEAHARLYHAPQLRSVPDLLEEIDRALETP